MYHVWPPSFDAIRCNAVVIERKMWSGDAWQVSKLCICTCPSTDLGESMCRLEATWATQFYESRPTAPTNPEST